MIYSIREVTDKNQWENFVLNYHPDSFLHSWNWGQFSQLQDERTFYLGVFNGQGNLVGVALFNEITARRGSYLTCHGGPMIDWDNPEIFDALVLYLKDLAKKEKVWFIRIRPPLFHSDEKVKFFRKQGFILAPMYFQAEYTLHLDLTQSEEELLKNMRKNTRYGIKRAQREEIVIEKSQDPAALNQFYQLYQATVGRQYFVAYPKKFFADELKIFSQDNQIQIFLAKYQNEILAGAVVVFYGDFAYYHHGASLKKHEEKCASYLVQWEAILETKLRGFKFYDFWGVAPTNDPKHPRAGLTFFKEGFGGQRVRWQQTMDLPVSWKYWLTYGFVKLERLKRGL